ncbi:Type I Iterative PKS [Purpureocillium takamizusanense]|uniref:Type I Iterative PKS n=1 Tax=Purpureocillium takamizusanense TaxID=2060973 RepID=A0A9Q8QAC2_9HYPO|nr:Type I Iterative PKS [Purpureocillium takamizusanense]UNI16448.1 Type I Iterative PKS [Purpureocillium takamizusanense]
MAEPIAIVGMAMRLPGNVRTGNEFWRMLVEKRNGLCDVPQDRYNVNGFHDPSGKPSTFRMNKGYFLQDVDIAQFDTSFFSLSKAELERLDPQQRQLLEVAYECMEDAGATSWRGSNTGCYVGVFGDDWQDLNAKETLHKGGYRVTGYDDFVLGNRISYEFDLHGPSMTVKTGCSSSLVCLDMACEAIRKGDCDGSLVCGTGLIFSPTMTLALSDQGVLSPSGICKTFDASADGYGRGEAVNAIYIKRLSQAIEDGDSIRAVVRGTSVNCDGRTQAMLTPSPTAQESLIRRAYEQAGIQDMSRTAMVECHGTGTSVGDPLEATAVANCFGDQGVYITSVKPNVGHSEGAAGLTSLIKAVLAIEHRLIPPNIFFKSPNPAIPFSRCKLRVPVETEEWPAGRAERVSVNSFGIGGVNAHVIVESLQEYHNHDQLSPNGSISSASPAGDMTPTDSDSLEDVGSSESGSVDVFPNSNDVQSNGHSDPDEPMGHKGSGSKLQGHETRSTDSSITRSQNGYGLSQVEYPERPHLLLFSANSEPGLKDVIKTYQEFLPTSHPSLTDVAYTLALRRDHKTHRAFAIAGSKSSLELSQLETVKAPPRIAWIFTGQGAQWPQMGADLIDTNAVFQGTIRGLDAFLAGLPSPPPWTIEDELRKTAENSRVQKAEFGHPLSIAVQIGLIDVLKSWGLRPDSVLGHSSGEMAAAYASGSITAKAAMAAATFRGTTSTGGTAEKRGSMAAIGLGAHEMAPYMEPGVVIACENSQCSVTISGDSEQVEKVVQSVKAQREGVLARFLRVEKAFHSHHMLEYGPLYEEHLQPFVNSSSPIIPFYSSVTGKRLADDGCLGPAYWRRNMESPVLFNTALRSAMSAQEGRLVLIEIGPHPALKGPVGQILRDMGRSADVHVGTLHRDKGCDESLLQLAGKLFQQDVPVDFSHVLLPSGRHVANLPRYPWKRDNSYWAESRMTREWRFREHGPHELLGSRVIEVSNEPCWRTKLALDDVSWLSGHEVGGQVIFPGAGYISMVGEAIRQLHGELAYGLKNVSIKAGLVLEHGKTVEIVTNLSAVATDSSDEASWYTFSISSYDGTKWVKHCVGEARPSVDKAVQLSVQSPKDLARTVDGDEWYNILNRVGFNYTGLFRGLHGITAEPGDNRSAASVPSLGPSHTGKFAMHPAVMDQCFQLFTVAAYRGLGRNCKNIAVPTFIEEIIVRPTTHDLRVGATIHTLERGSFVGDLVAEQSGQLQLSLKGFKASALTRSDDEDERLPLITRLEWRPHAHFVSLADHLHPRPHIPREWPLFEEMMLLCAIDHLETIKLTEETQPHLRKFFSWMQDQVDKYQSGDNLFIANDRGLLELTKAQRLARIADIAADGEKSQYPAFGIAIHRLFQAAESIFSGETHPLHVLMKDDVLTQFYAVGDELNYASALRVLGHTNPRLRILEVGAGTGGTTVKVLKALTSSSGERLYSSYTYTDISAGFMASAKERFAGADGLQYATLDISQNPSEQGYQMGSYDLIIGSNVVHATPHLNVSLSHLRSLLSPGGKLFLQELCPDAKYVNYVMGFLPGWWLGESDNRPDEPYISPERWAEEMLAAGFAKPEAMVVDGATPYQQSAGIIASPAYETPRPPKVSLLSHSIDGAYVTEAKLVLEDLGFTVDVITFGQELPSHDVISLLDLQTFTVHDLDDASFRALVAQLQSLDLDSKIIWATRSAQVACTDPRTAMSLGLTRTARSELSTKLFTVEIDDKTDRLVAARCLADILLRRHSPQLDVESMDPDWEYAIIDGQVLVPRMHWQTMGDAFEQIDDESSQPTAKQLTVKTPGLLHTMGWSESERVPLKEGQVTVQTRAIGLNFRDVLIALGILDNSTREIGLEGSGMVTEVGPGVDKLRPGDRVIYMSSGCFTTHITLSQTLCVKLDDGLTFEQGAALPCVYATAAMALVDKANLQPGQTILIHSACGGVGLAAIQIAQMLGAEVFCTVGNEDKVRYLMDNHHIRRNRIFNSRDTSFLRDVMAVTSNKGVDVVLNSLSGELLHASWRCVAEFGTMIEIGKRDFRRRAKLSMEAFEANRTFVGLDLWQVSQVRPEQVARLLERCIKWMQEGLIKPGVIAKVWDAQQVQDAFRFMQGGRHIGKIIVRMPVESSVLESTKERPLPHLRPDRSYLLVGGLGGLGRSIATWMVENGARHLVFLSRSAQPGPHLERFVGELTAQGCEVQLVSGSVSSLDDVKQAVNSASKPIAGVMNFSMVLRDISLSDMSFADWTTAVSPKVEGTWNLHHAITSELDFFILCSSYSGIVGQWGQANYAAANTFLDAFVQYRHHQGLAASVIDIGVMGEVGFVSKNQDILGLFQKSGMRILKEQDLLDAMNLAILRSKPAQTQNPNGGYGSPGQILLGLVTSVPIASPNNRVVWKNDIRMSIYHNINGGRDSASAVATELDDITTLLKSAASDPSVLQDKESTVIIATAIASALANFLIKEDGSIKLDDSPEHAGLDSLVAMELRNWIRQRFGVDTTVMTIVQSTSIMSLGDYIREALVKRSR